MSPDLALQVPSLLSKLIELHCCSSELPLCRALPKDAGQMENAAPCTKDLQATFASSCAAEAKCANLTARHAKRKEDKNIQHTALEVLAVMQQSIEED